ncbi:MAG: hypothetical protein H6Q18_869, partial [Bacteroidetes bacterium]|nr:hypothetical protein [Bacteroidota bacterium]
MSINYYVADRKPAVAGQFYPAKADELEKEIIQLFSKAAPKKYEHVRAIISPHAGYIFSGTVAASAFNQIDTTVNYKHIFILGSSHHYHFDGAAVYCN